MTSAMKPKRPCAECSKPTVRFHPVFKVPLCRKCQNSVPKYKTIGKTRAMREYKLTPEDLEKLDYHKEPNLHSGFGFARQYLLAQFQALAEKQLNAFAGDWATCASEVRKARTDDFRELLRIGNLDPARHLRFADWSGISFRDCDLTDFDFTGARLHNCDFTDALIDGARFDQAEISGANLNAARDWKAHARHWTLPQEAVRNADRSLPLFEPFQDAPFAPQMVVVPAGEFMMGSPEDEPGRDDSEGPQHEERIPQALAVGRYAVTFEEWDFAQDDNDWSWATGTGPRKPNDYRWGRNRRPVIDVSWDDAKAYVKWLAHRTGQAYRLLSEAEWEYACRAGSAASWHFGDDEGLLADYAWFSRNSDGQTQSVGEKKPNDFGLYDMHGNVLEWCEDVWHADYEDKPEELIHAGGAWTTGDGSHGVLRGGSCNGGPLSLRAACRAGYDPDDRGYDVGFRVARTLNP